LVQNSAMKNDLKSSPIDILWVVFNRNSTGNNCTNGKVDKNGTCFQYWGGDLEFERGVVGIWSLKEGFEVRILSLYLGF